MEYVTFDACFRMRRDWAMTSRFIRVEQTLDGKTLPKHVKMFRDMNGCPSEAICTFWDDDAIEFAAMLLKRESGIS